MSNITPDYFQVSCTGPHAIGETPKYLLHLSSTQSTFSTWLSKAQYELLKTTLENPAPPTISTGFKPSENPSSSETPPADEAPRA